jgi:hypothetical protein
MQREASGPRTAQRAWKSIRLTSGGVHVIMRGENPARR